MVDTDEPEAARAPHEEIMSKEKEVTDLTGLAGLVKDISVTMEEEHTQVVAQLKDLQDRGKKLEDWIKEVEKTTSEAMKGHAGPSGYADGAKLMEAIPKRHRKCLDRYARTGMKREEVIKTVAMESWMKNAIKIHDNSLGRITERLLKEMQDLSDAMGFESMAAEQRAAMQEDTDTEGGYTVPVPIEATVLRLAEDAGVMRSLVRTVPMVTKEQGYPDLQSNITVIIVPEEGTIPTSEPTLGQKRLIARKFSVRAITSMELIQDSAVGILPFLVELMTEKYALKEDQQILEGLGVGGEFMGVAGSAGINTVTNLPNGALFTPAKALEQKWKGRKQATRRGSAWIMAPEIAAQIEGFRVDAAAAADKAGGFLYVPTMNAGGVEGVGAGPSPDGTLHGFPLYSHSEIKTDRVVGSGTNCSNVYFGPWGMGYYLGDLLGLSFAVSEHTQWATGQLDLRMIKRTGGLVAIPQAFTVQTGVKIA